MPGGWRAIASAGQCPPRADFEAAGLAATTTLQSALVAPLVFNERFIGTLAVYSLHAGFYTDDHRRLLDRVCEQASAVIHNSIVFEQTQEDSLTDPLTGLPNTRFMFMHLTRELARAERLKAEVALLVMDLDNFKEINDHHGHHVGDRALREVAAVLRDGIRPYDMCVRYAGDEFIVVLSGAAPRKPNESGSSSQRAVDQVVFEARPGRRLPLAISVGAAIYPHDGENVRSAAGHRRQPHVPRQDAAESSGRRCSPARPEPTASRRCRSRCSQRSSPRSRSSARGSGCFEALRL